MDYGFNTAAGEKILIIMLKVRLQFGGLILS